MKTEFISAKETAKLVRARLKKVFPGVKFSVRTDGGTTCSTLRIKWQDGMPDNTLYCHAYDDGTASILECKGGNYETMRLWKHKASVLADRFVMAEAPKGIA